MQALKPAHPSLPALAEQAHDYARAAKAPATRRAYRGDWADFSGWCETQGLDPLPAAPPTVALYLTHLAQLGRKVATLDRRLSTISQAHRTAGYPSPRPSPEVQAVWQGIKRTHGVAQNRAKPLLVPDLTRIVAAMPPGRMSARNRALILLGFAAGLRRSEIAAIQIEDIAAAPEGLVLTLPRSKTDQTGAGRRIGVPFATRPDLCPVLAVRYWLQISIFRTGPLFPSRNGRPLHGHDVNRILQRAARDAGLDARGISGHSLRAGFVTAAALAGKPEHAIQAQTGHRSIPMLRRYIRDADLFSNNAATGLL